ncbi:unnamed protein product [Adineta steineri]|uniref:DYW domain-containing protein n=1 Tax=Adineta steineri TaxID=433720 RepID=A0A814JLW7_9BILA|nr:unnamed protein product [Adineta steineri]
MSNRLLIPRLSSLTIFVKRSMINIESDFDLGMKMKSLNDNKQFNKSLELFDKFKINNVKSLSNLTISQALKACINLDDVQRGRNIHQLISSRINKDSYILISLIHFYSYIKNNEANKVIDLFNEIKDPDEVIIILLFNACAQLANEEGLNLIEKVSKQIPQSFMSNPRLLTSLLDAKMKCDHIKSTQILLSKSRQKSLSMYETMMNEFNENEDPLKTIDLFNEIKTNHIVGSIRIYTYIIQALSQIADYSISKSIIEQIPKPILIDDQISNGRIGYVDKAEEIFKRFPQPDQIAYASMISCYGFNGMGIKAIELYYKIPLKLINESINICILNACSFSGLIDQTRSIFENIRIKTERIYTTMVDCLSRTCLFDEAKQLIDQFEHSHLPQSPMYLALLSNAMIKKNKSLSKEIGEKMKKHFPQIENPSISVSILFDGVDDVDELSTKINKASDIIMELNQSGMKKTVGHTTTVVNGQIYKFRAHDRSHPQSKEIYDEINKISKELISHGHKYDPSWITRSLNEYETIESVFNGHSEKLAIAWNFISNPHTTRIQLTNDLRICGDCHRAIKLITLIRQCEIIIRDANRIHHFYKNGQCSCDLYELNFNSFWCIIMGYCSPLVLSTLYFGFVNQAFFRLCRIIYWRNEWIQSFLFYIIIPFIELIICALLSSPILFWHDIIYLPNDYFCYVSVSNTRDILWIFFVSFGNCILILLFIYIRITIYLRQQSTNQIIRFRQGQQRDLIVIKRIFITVGLLSILGIPAAVFLFLFFISGQVHPLVWRIELFFVGLQMIGLCLSQITLIPQLKQIILQKFQHNRVITLNTIVTRSILLKQYITTR